MTPYLPEPRSTLGEWTWDQTQKVSGTQSFSKVASTSRQSASFDNAPTTMTVDAGYVLVAHALVKPCATPLDVIITWKDQDDIEKRAYWGVSMGTLGEEGTPTRMRMGEMPTSGQWARLEVPASEWRVPLHPSVHNESHGRDNFLIWLKEGAQCMGPAFVGPVL